ASWVLSVSFFFFSSRRRHTRSKRDWSSDVCSSDLPCSRSPPRVRGKVSDMERIAGIRGITPARAGKRQASCGQRSRRRDHPRARSEERRVGKEWRSGGGRGHEKKQETGSGWRGHGG